MNDRLVQAQQGTHLDFLDGIRGFAVSYVLLYHFLPKTLSLTNPGVLFRIWDTFWMMGWSGVDLFFVLSGFLITGILYKAREKPGYFRKFYIRRFFRIFPAYYLLVLLSAIFFYPEQLSPYYWLYLSNFDVELKIPFNEFLCVGWSLSIEEQYYVFYPTLVKVLTEKMWRRLLTVLIILSVSLRFIGHDHFWIPRQMYHNTVAHFDGIALGGLLRLLLFRYDEHKKLIDIYVRLTPIILLAVVVLGFYCGSVVLANELNPHGHKDLGLVSFCSPMYLFGYLLNSLLFGAVILCCIFSDGPIYKLASNSILRNIGKYSYAMYLFQFPVSHLVASLSSKLHMNPHPFILAGLKFTALYLIARLSWVLLEAPMGRVRDMMLAAGNRSSR